MTGRSLEDLLESFEIPPDNPNFSASSSKMKKSRFHFEAFKLRGQMEEKYSRRMFQKTFPFRKDILVFNESFSPVLLGSEKEKASQKNRPFDIHDCY